MLLKQIHGFYPIIDTSLVTISNVKYITQMIIEAGAGIIQLRGKDISTREFIETAKIIKPLTEKNNTTFVINDRVDIAVLVNANGVHLGQDDLPIKEARKILGRNKIIGISTHNIKEAVIAEKLGADYISFGPIFATSTKKDAQNPKGVNGLKSVRQNTSLPIAAIGGITLENARDVYNAGADCIAVISDILKTKDIKDRIIKFARLSGS